MRDVRNREFPFKLCQGFCHAGMMSKRSEMMSCHYRIETHVSRTPAAFGLALIPAGATQAASQVGNAVWSGSRMNLRNSLSNPLSVMHSAGQNVSHTLYMYMCLRKPCNPNMNLRHLENSFCFSRYGSNTGLLF